MPLVPLCKPYWGVNMATPEEKIGIVYMRPDRPPRYFQISRKLAEKKMTAAIRYAEKHGYCFVEEKAKAALDGLLQNKKNNR